MADTTEHLATLPAELVLLVAEVPSLSTRDLVAFALTNSKYARWIIPALYRKNIREENASACKTFLNNHKYYGTSLP